MNNPPEESRGSLNTTAKVIFFSASTLFSLLSVLDPLGAVGLPLAILAGAMLSLLAIGEDKPANALVWFLSAPISMIVAAIVLLAFSELDAAHIMLASMTSLYPLAMALPIWLTVITRQGRAVSIVSASLLSALLWAAYLLISLSLSYGEITIVNLSTMLDDIYSPVREALLSLPSLTEGIIGQTGMVISETDIDAMITSAKQLTIGAFAALLIIFSYLTTAAARLIAKTFGLLERFPFSIRVRVRAVKGDDGPTVELSQTKIPWRLELDSVSALIMIAAYLVTVFLDSENPMPLAITAMNLILILSPGFIYAGVREVFGGSSAGRNPGCLVIPIVIVFTFLNPIILAMMLAVIGVSAVLRENIRKSKAEKLAEESKHGDDNRKE